MADAGEGDAAVLMRIREQGGAFEHRQDFSDEKLNDGNNYKGLMKASDYKKRRIEVLEDPVAKKLEAKLEAITAAKNADRNAREREEREREEREAARRAKLKAELNGEHNDAAGEVQDARKEKKRRKKKAVAEVGALSFDVED
mmetsp:Transcript_41680/g.109935  ORF Transcript_41680/g.109935 Transcript_41680/m.109935 type:complete len:143 (-) Transcript_41680:291-719(-)